MNAGDRVSVDTLVIDQTTATRHHVRRHGTITHRPGDPIDISPLSPDGSYTMAVIGSEFYGVTFDYDDCVTIIRAEALETQ